VSFARRLTSVRILRPLRHRDFALLISGRAVSMSGDGFFIVALAWQVYLIDNDPAALSLVGFAGTVPLHDGWYSVEVRHQPTLNADRVRVSIDVPEGWSIDQAPHLKKQYARLATTSIALQRTTTFRVHITRDPAAWDLWERLRAGT